MSYEGYTQVLCENGHYFTYNCYDYEDFDGWKCPECQTEIAWSNMVDETNGSWEDNGPFDDDHRIDGFVPLYLIDECRCKECGHILEQRYRLPTREEERRAKPWRV
jgi:hypothetical protein